MSSTLSATLVAHCSMDPLLEPALSSAARAAPRRSHAEAAQPPGDKPHCSPEQRIHMAEQRRKDLMKQRQEAACADVLHSKTVAAEVARTRRKTAEATRADIEQRLLKSEERRKQSIEERRHPRPKSRGVTAVLGGSPLLPGHGDNAADNANINDVSILSDFSLASIPSPEPGADSASSVENSPSRLAPDRSVHAAVQTSPTRDEGVVGQGTDANAGIDARDAVYPHPLAERFAVNHPKAGGRPHAHGGPEGDGPRKPTLLQEHHARAKIHNAEIASKTVLHQSALRRHLAHERVRLLNELQEGTKRHMQCLDDRVQHAREHWHRVQATYRRVLAARQLQRWYRSTLARRHAGIGAGARVVTLRQKRAMEKLTSSFRVEPLYKCVQILQQLLQIGGGGGGARDSAAQHRRSESSAAAAERAGIQPAHAADNPFASFDECAAAIQSKRVLTAAQCMIKAWVEAWTMAASAGIVCEACDDAACTTHISFAGKPALHTSPRTLLASLLVAFFPEDLLVTDSHADGHGAAVPGSFGDAFNAAFVESARAFIASLRTFLDAIRAENEDAHGEFTQCVVAWVKYTEFFQAWKQGDGLRMAETLAPTYVELLRRYEGYCRELATPSGREDAGLHELCEGTRLHIERLKAQVVALIGQERAREWEARILTGEAATAASGEAEVHMPAPYPLPAQSPVLSKEPVAAGGAPSAAMHKAVLSNHALVHEIMVNPDFRLPSPTMPDDLQRVCGYRNEEQAEANAPADVAELVAFRLVSEPSPSTVTLAHWLERVQSSFDRSDAAVIEVVTGFRDRLVKLISHKRDLCQRIAEVLDPDLYAGAARHGGVMPQDWIYLCQFVVDQVLHLEAPARNDQTTGWWNSFQVRFPPASLSDGPDATTAVAAAIAFCNFKLTQLERDIANVQIRTLMPFLKAHNRGVQYEQAKLRDTLGEFSTYAGTHAWLRTAVAACGQARSELISNPPGRLQLVAEGVCTLLSLPCATTAVASAARASGRASARIANGDGSVVMDVAFPETLELDAGRLERVQDVLQRTSLLAAIFHVVQRTVQTAPAATARDAEPDVQVRNLSELAEFLDTLLMDSTLHFDELAAGVAAATNSLLASLHKQQLHPEDGPHSVMQLRHAVGEILAPDHTVRALMHKRGLALLRARLAREMRLDATSMDAWLPAWRDADRDAGVAERSLTQPGVRALDAAAAQIGRIVMHNDAVFGSQYAEFLAAHLAPTGGDGHQ